MYKISEVTKQTNISADTLRYYEKIGVMPKISRSASGVRLFDKQDISRLKFIKRAQRMNFSLDEIKLLLSMREDPQHARNEIRQLTADKLKAVESQLTELKTLHNELQLLLNLCKGTPDGCPIIESIDGE